MSESEKPMTDVTLPGMGGSTVSVYRLCDDESSSLLAFPPTSVGVNELDPTHPLWNLTWFQFTASVNVYVVVDHGKASIHTGPDQLAGVVPHLTDAEQDLAAACGIADRGERETTWVCLVDQTGTVQSRWATDTEGFDLDAVHETIRETITENPQ
ncbi:hypothetical protein D3D02_02205 [Halobellus sp. Atlit-38R]|jgi:hypothetical protein|uniref:hypothetical protein n=1 Tax=Halobellus sp. Atlit-38R TaxID=2282131 RepID=UPI000EF2175F|nr:hypothetical protein [Halobellus sp. Atlit-38R]RLM94816.1 hypothetical protein D3D02_02205 [Halobellus sp. Atlit-38R]